MSLSASVSSAATMFIGGKWREAGDSYERVAPGELSRRTGSYAMAAPADVSLAHDAAAARA